MIFKLLINFAKLSYDALLGKAQRIKVALTSEPALTLLPDPWPATYPSRTQITAAYTGYESAYDAARDGSKTSRTLRDQKQAVLIQVLKDAAPYFEVVAKAANDMTILNATGYDVRSSPEPIPQPVAAPELKVFRSEFSGVVQGKSKAVDGGLGYEGQYCLAADTSEANWRTAFFSNGVSKLNYEGLTPGQMYCFRLRALGRDGWSSWSAVVQLMAA